MVLTAYIHDFTTPAIVLRAVEDPGLDIKDEEPWRESRGGRSK